MKPIIVVIMAAKFTERLFYFLMCAESNKVWKSVVLSVQPNIEARCELSKHEPCCEVETHHTGSLQVLLTDPNKWKLSALTCSNCLSSAEFQAATLMWFAACRRNFRTYHNLRKERRITLSTPARLQRVCLHCLSEISTRTYPKNIVMICQHGCIRKVYFAVTCAII